MVMDNSNVEIECFESMASAMHDAAMHGAVHGPCSMEHAASAVHACMRGMRGF
jgi:hypothetical protein